MNMTTPLLKKMTTSKHAFNKVPQISIIFWIIKLLSTLMGEATSDALSHLGAQRGGPPPGMGHEAVLSISPFMIVISIILIITMVLQIKSRRYVPWKYWLNVVTVAVFGTAAADAVHIGYVLSTALFGILLASILIVWYSVEKTLSVHSIYTIRREIFYWATVIATFMLGTALGDMTAENLDLGNLVSGLMFIGLMAIPAVAYKLLGMNEIVSFWFAYIMTRPLGASFADWMSYGHGGLGLGNGPVGLVSTIIIIGLVAYISFTTKKEVEIIYKPEIA